jgi:hypothetical protein
MAAAARRREIGRLFLGFGSSPRTASRKTTRGEGRVGREERGWEGSVVEGIGAAARGAKRSAPGYLYDYVTLINNISEVQSTVHNAFRIEYVYNMYSFI